MALAAFGILTIWVEGRWAWSAVQLWTFATGIAWGIARLRRKVPARFSFVVLPPAFACAWGALQLLAGWTEFRWRTLEWTFHWLTFANITFLGLQCFSYAKLRRTFLRGTFYFAGALAIVSVIQMFTAGGKVFWIFPTKYEDFVLGPFISRNAFSAMIELTLPVGLIELFRNRRRIPAHAALVAAMAAAVIAGAGRAGAALVIAELLLIPWLASRRAMIEKRTLRLASATALGLAAVFTLVVGWEALWMRLTDRTHYPGRGEYLISSMRMFRERPWTGFGLGTWPAVYPQYAVMDVGTLATHAHNDWAEWACDGGIFLVIVMAALAVWSVRPAFRTLWGAGIVFVFLHCMVEFVMQRPPLAAAVFLLIGVLAGAQREIIRLKQTLSSESP